jgi:hypothetical protein
MRIFVQLKTTVGTIIALQMSAEQGRPERVNDLEKFIN